MWCQEILKHTPSLLAGPSGFQQSLSSLLPTLQLHPAAKRLRSPRRSVSAELTLFNAYVQSDDFDLSPFTPLTKLVRNNARDLDIWQAVL